jgi:molecular chaperone DnaK (HSP70)
LLGKAEPLSLSTLNTQEGTVVEATRKHLKEIGKTVVEVIGDYLRFLWSHILARVKVRLTAPVLDNMVLKVVLTVPAIWDHSAHQKMRNAARLAGILDYRACGKTEISLIAEPTAAALATYYDAEIKMNPMIKVLGIAPSEETLTNIPGVS